MAKHETVETVNTPQRHTVYLPTRWTEWRKLKFRKINKEGEIFIGDKLKISMLLL